MKGLLAYAIGGLLISSGAGGLGAIIICLGFVAHWKWWLLGVGSFLIGRADETRGRKFHKCYNFSGFGCPSPEDLDLSGFNCWVGRSHSGPLIFPSCDCRPRSAGNVR